MARWGAGVVELVVALVLLALVVQGLWTVFATQRRSAEDLRFRSELLDADRIVRVVLGAEVRAGVPRRDWWVSAPGVLEVRAFRGWGVVCPGGVDGNAAVVAYRGLRDPDPDKDSVLVLGGSGAWTVAALVSRVRLDEGCAGAGGALPADGASLERWTLSALPPHPVLFRWFERGSYHLTDGSLRYRRGAGGRQPLTPPVLDPGVSGLDTDPSGTVVRLRLGGQEDLGGRWGRSFPGNVGRLP